MHIETAHCVLIGWMILSVCKLQPYCVRDDCMRSQPIDTLCAILLSAWLRERVDAHYAAEDKYRVKLQQIDYENCTRNHAEHC